MDNTDRKIRDLYNTVDQSNVPAHLRWDNMEAGIREKMPSPKRRRKFGAWWWFAGGVAAVVVLWSTLFLITSTNGEKISIASADRLTSESSSSLSVDTDISASTALEAKKTAVGPEDTFDASINTVIASSEEKQVLVPTTTNEIISTSTQVQETAVGESNRVSQGASLTAVIGKENTPSLERSVISSVPDRLHIDNISLVPTINGTLTKDHEWLDIPQLTNVEPIETATRRRWLMASGGLNTWSSRDNPLPASSITSMPGLSGSISAMLPLRGKWLLHTSIAANSYIERIQHSGTDQALITTPVVLIAYNSLSGRVSNTSTRDSLISVKRNRQLDFYNVHATVGLQLGAAYEVSLGSRWTLLPSLQMGIDRVLYQTGVKIDADGEYQSISTSSPLLTSYRASLAPSMQVAYHLTDRWSLTGGIIGQIGLSDWIVGPKAQSPSSAALRAGLAYRW